MKMEVTLILLVLGEREPISGDFLKRLIHIMLHAEKISWPGVLNFVITFMWKS
jgi:hypothetical protein